MNSREPVADLPLVPGEIFIHEAGHALAYDALGIPLRSCTVFVSSDSKAVHGSTLPMTDGPAPAFPSMCFILMAGPAAHMYVAGRPFESIFNRFYSDFSFLFLKFRQLLTTDRETAAMIVKLRIFAETFCKEWVVRNREPILQFARALEKTPVSEDRYELSGTALIQALALAWRPSADALVAQLTSSLTPIFASPVEIPSDSLSWLNNWIGRMRQQAATP
jgi:hypothetical protein